MTLQEPDLEMKEQKNYSTIQGSSLTTMEMYSQKILMFVIGLKNFMKRPKNVF